MPRMQRRWTRWGGVSAAFLALIAAPPESARGYIINPLPTLGYTVAESTHVMLVRVEDVSREKGVVIYRKVRDLRGKYPKDTLRHAFKPKGGPACAGKPFHPDVEEWSYVLQWAEPGKEAVLFIRKDNNGGDSGLAYVDQCWYSSFSTKDDWVWFHTLRALPDLLRKYYCGSPARLAAAVDVMVARGADLEGNPVVPTLQEGSVADLRAGKAKVRGLRVGCGRTKIDLKRDTAAWEDPKAAEALGKGLRDEAQAARLRAARGLAHWFGPEAKGTLPALTAALAHADPATRRAAASALANPHLAAGRAVPALCDALKDEDPEVALRATEALCALRGEGRAAAPALRKAVGAGGARGDAAAAALVSVEPGVEAGLPSVKAILQRRASVGGKYRNPLRRIGSPQDLVAGQFFRDQAAIVGPSPAVADYRGNKDIPKGYWVYAYPYWYVWGERAEPK